MRRRFHTLDVFTDTRFCGNPLAVVLDTEGLDTARMQAIAREFNLSETVFVLEPRDPVHTARLRIFTPKSELPFAGHPTVGAAALIGKLRAGDLIAHQDIGLVIEEGVGDINCTVRQPKGRPLYAGFDLPRLPERIGDTASDDAIAAALSLNASDIGFDAHRPGIWSAGNAITFVPVATQAAVARARPVAGRFENAFAGAPLAFLYTKETEHADHHVHARMFAPSHGIPEDPATGSAAAAFAGVAVAFENPDDGAHTLMIEQGFEMGRPSLMALTLEIEDGHLVAASIGGAVVMVSEGQIEA